MAAHLTTNGPSGGIAFMATVNTLTNAAIQTNHYLAGAEIYDTGSDLTMNAAGSTQGSNGMVFTAPVTGKYQLQVWLEVNNVPSNAIYHRLAIETSNRTYNTFQTPTVAVGGVDQHCIVCADMDAGDIATPKFYVNNGTVTIDLTGAQTAFSGFLIG
jgi:hypothetical protein